MDLLEELEEVCVDLLEATTPSAVVRSKLGKLWRRTMASSLIMMMIVYRVGYSTDCLKWSLCVPSVPKGQSLLHRSTPPHTHAHTFSYSISMQEIWFRLNSCYSS